MHIETTCPGCQRKLRVLAEHAGATARCPVCQATYTVPAESATAEAADPRDRWRLKIPEGQEFGPVSRSELDKWVSEGRVCDECRILCDADGVWRTAAEIYPVLRPAPVGVVAPIWHNVPASAANPAAPRVEDRAVRGYITNSDRGGLVLAMGILSWAIGCPVFGVLAWVMGSSDLGEMRQGTMDPRGQGMTEAGRIIGMLHVLVCMIALLVGIFLLLFWGVLL